YGNSGDLRRGGFMHSRSVGGKAGLQAGIRRGNNETAAVVCGRDDSAGAGERAGERFDGAGEIQGRSADGAAGCRLRINAAVHASSISRSHGSGVANARRFQSVAAGRVRRVHVGSERKSENGGWRIENGSDARTGFNSPSSILYSRFFKSGPGNGCGAR